MIRQSKLDGTVYQVEILLLIQKRSLSMKAVTESEGEHFEQNFLLTSLEEIVDFSDDPLSKCSQGAAWYQGLFCLN